MKALVRAVQTDPHHVKAVKPLPSRKIKKPVPLTDCFIAPCKEGCPIHQDITAYLQLERAGRHKEALEVILEKNPLPFITGTICAHTCMSKCTRNFYERPVDIRRAKREAAQGGFEEVLAREEGGARGWPGRCGLRDAGWPGSRSGKERPLWWAAGPQGWRRPISWRGPALR